MTELVWDLLYLSGAIGLQAFSWKQIYHIFKAKSAKDFQLSWVFAMLVCQFTLLPRVFISPYLVWQIAHVMAVICIGTLVLGVWKYGRKS